MSELPEDHGGEQATKEENGGSPMDFFREIFEDVPGFEIDIEKSTAESIGDAEVQFVDGAGGVFTLELQKSPWSTDQIDYTQIRVLDENSNVIPGLFWVCEARPAGTKTTITRQLANNEGLIAGESVSAGERIESFLFLSQLSEGDYVEGDLLESYARAAGFEYAETNSNEILLSVPGSSSDDDLLVVQFATHLDERIIVDKRLMSYSDWKDTKTGVCTRVAEELQIATDEGEDGDSGTEKKSSEELFFLLVQDFAEEDGVPKLHGPGSVEELQSFADGIAFTGDIPTIAVLGYVSEPVAIQLLRNTETVTAKPRSDALLQLTAEDLDILQSETKQDRRPRHSG